MAFLWNMKSVGKWIVFHELTETEEYICLCSCREVAVQQAAYAASTRKGVSTMPRGPVTYQVIKGSIIRETDKAVRFDIAQAGHILDGEAFWFPLSQIKQIMRSHNDCEDEIEVAEWLIQAKADELAGQRRG